MFRTAILIILAFGIGVLLPILNPTILPDHHGTEGEDTNKIDEHRDPSPTNSMKHDPIDIDPTLPIPSVVLTVEKDAMAGYNAFLELENFTFIPQKASNTGPIANEGHAHLYVNDVKVGRVYGNAYHIPDSYFTLGKTNQVKVTLNAHSHSDRTQEGKPIESIVDILHDSTGHMH